MEPPFSEVRVMQPAPGVATEPVAPDQFWRCCAESGLLPVEEVKALAKQLRGNTKALAQELMKQGKLTRYQAIMLCQGRSKGMVVAGNYIIQDKIGQGGMGMVFKALSRRLNRVIALKVLPPSFAQKTNAVQRFQREVQAVARLSHANIVSSFDAGEDKGVYFLAMEFVDGTDLSRLVKQQGTLSPEAAVACLLQAARGLEYAHAAGIIHRDIKPGNLLLAQPTPAQPTGLLKILDMGLARFEEGAEDANELTQTGTMVGTCDYVAPEQAINSKNADQRSDIYSLGCTLYFLLTGKVMYAGDTAMEKLLAHREQPIPALRAARPEVSRKLEAVYQRMVAKAADQRYRTMTEVIADLEGCATGDEPARSLAAWVQRAFNGLKAPQDKGEKDAAADSKPTHEATVADGPQPRHRRVAALAVAAAMLLGGLLLIVSLAGSSAEQAAVSTAPPPPAPTGQGETVGKRPPTDPARPDHEVDEGWIKATANLNSKLQFKHVLDKMRELNPGMRGRPFSLEPRFDTYGQLIAIGIDTDNVTAVWPLRAFTHLQSLRCSGSKNSPGKLTDLSQLQGLHLHTLLLGRNPGLTDLRPLKNMPLRHLAIPQTQVSDLSPLEHAPLEHLDITDTQVRELRPVRHMPLRFLQSRGSPISDLSPLRNLKLEAVDLDVRTQSDWEVISSIKTLKEINNRPAEEFLARRPNK